MNYNYIKKKNYKLFIFFTYVLKNNKLIYNLQIEKAMLIKNKK